MVGQPLCLVAGARARGGWRVVLDDARGAAGSLRALAGLLRVSGERGCCVLCLLVCESCVAKKYQGRRPRGVVLVLYVSATRLGPVGGLFVVLLRLLCSGGPESSGGTRHKCGGKARDPYLHAST